MQHPERATVIYGPAGCGKSTHAKAFATHYGKARIIDDASAADAPFPDDALVLTNDPSVPDALHYELACVECGLSAQGMNDALGWITVAAPQVSPSLQFRCGESPQVFVVLRPDGRVEIPDGVSLDDAALAFWKAVEKLAPDFVRGAQHG